MPQTIDATGSKAEMRKGFAPTFVAANPLMMAEWTGLEPTPILTIARSLRVDEIVVAAEDADSLPMWELLECKLNGIDVVDYLTFWEREGGLVDFTHAGPGWFVFSEGFLINQPRRFLKRVADFCVSLGFLIAFLPVIPFTSMTPEIHYRSFQFNSCCRLSNLAATKPSNVSKSQ